MPCWRNIPRESDSHRAVFGHDHPTSKHRSPGFIALKTSRRSHGIQWMPAPTILVAERRGGRPWLGLTGRAQQFMVWIYICRRAGRIERATEWYPGVKAISPHKFANPLSSHHRAPAEQWQESRLGEPDVDDLPTSAPIGR